MQDYQRQEFVARERILRPDVFGVTLEQARLLDMVSNAPMYINKTPQVDLKPSARVDVYLPDVAIEELENFVGDHLTDLGDWDLDDLKFFHSLSLNGIAVRTKSSEATLKTRDSIVCGRFPEFDDTLSMSSDSNDDCLDNTDQMVFGQVLYIAVLGGVCLCNVDWFQSIPEVVTQDQRNGCDIVKVYVGRKRNNLMNNWIRADCLSFQQHVVIGALENGKDAHLFARI